MIPSTPWATLRRIQRASSLVVGNPTPPSLNDFAGHVQLEKTFLPADTDVVITLKEGVGGTPAGTAKPHGR